MAAIHMLACAHPGSGAGQSRTDATSEEDWHGAPVHMLAAADLEQVLWSPDSALTNVAYAYAASARSRRRGTSARSAAVALGLSAKYFASMARPAASCAAMSEAGAAASAARARFCFSRQLKDSMTASMYRRYVSMLGGVA